MAKSLISTQMITDLAAASASRHLRNTISTAEQMQPDYKFPRSMEEIQRDLIGIIMKADTDSADGKLASMLIGHISERAVEAMAPRSALHLRERRGYRNKAPKAGFMEFAVTDELVGRIAKSKGIRRSFFVALLRKLAQPSPKRPRNINTIYRLFIEPRNAPRYAR